MSGLRPPLRWQYVDRDHGAWLLLRLPAARARDRQRDPRVRGTGDGARLRQGRARSGDLEVVDRAAQGPGHRHLVVGRSTTHLVEPALERQRQAASACAPRQRRCRGEVPGLHRVVPLGRSTHRRDGGIPPVGGRVGAHGEAAGDAARRRSHPSGTRCGHPRAAVRRRARPGHDRTGRSRGRRDAQHTSREWAPRPCTCGWRRQVRVRRGRRIRAGTHRGVGDGRRAVRSAATAAAQRRFASWRNSRTGCART